MMRALHPFIRDKSGGNAIEHAVIAVVIIVFVSRLESDFSVNDTRIAILLGAS